MRKLIYSMLVSLDGFIEGPNHELDWHLIDEEIHTYFNEREAEADTDLYGRRLYELMAAYWPTADANPQAPKYEVDFSRIWKSKERIVFSRTLEHAEWASRIVREDVAGEVARLKALPGKNLAVGGAELASTLVRRDLVDEYNLYVHPVVLGSGTPMFLGLTKPLNLQLIATHTFGSGVVLLRYVPAR